MKFMQSFFISFIITIILIIVAINVIKYFNLPEVYVNSNGKCVEVDSENGYFSCSDKDITLKKYILINVN